MYRLLALFLVLNASLSCSKNDSTDQPVAEIPQEINGPVSQFNLTPIDINTPDKGFMLIGMNNTFYRVTFNVVDQASSNAILTFANDSIITDDTKELANVGKDAVAFNPVRTNEVVVHFTSGRLIFGQFDNQTNFGGVFGDDLIAQWRTANNPTKPNQKAKDDIMNLVQRYEDKDGPGPTGDPIYLSVTVTKP